MLQKLLRREGGSARASRLARMIGMMLAPVCAVPLAQGSTLTISIVNQQVSTTSNFASGTVTDVPQGKGPFFDTSPAGYYVPKNGYFRFGLAVQVAGNPNPEAGGPWDKAAQSQYGVPVLPADMGFSTLGLRILSGDPLGKSMRPLSEKGLALTEFSDTSFEWGILYPGDAVGGVVGKDIQLFAGQIPANVRDPSFIPRLGYYTALTGFIESIPYHRTGDPTLLKLQVDPTATSLWSRPDASIVDDAGNILSDPVFRARYLTPNDSVSVTFGGTFATSGSRARTNLIPEPGAIALVAALGAFLAGRRSVPREFRVKMAHDAQSRRSQGSKIR